MRSSLTQKMISGFGLVAIVFFSGGIFMLFGLWPMNAIKDTHDYLFQDSRWGRHSVKEVLWNDLDILPYRHMATLEFEPVPSRHYDQVIPAGMRDRRQSALVYISPSRAAGTYTLISGLTDTEQSLYGVLLLDPNGRVVRQWDIVNGDADRSPETNVQHHGLALLDDGSIVVSFNRGSTLSRYGPCGDLVWRQPIAAHHTVTKDDSGQLWTFEGHDIIAVSVETGEVVKRITLADLTKNRPGRSVLTGRMFFDRHGSYFDYDPFHPNDVEALPASYVDAFPGFKTGDLLVSLRSGNLIFVVDPETYEIKWWMHEAGFAQHDPDWEPDGTITLFDNNTDFGASRIVRIEPKTRSVSVLNDGAVSGFRTDLMGSHELRSDGSLAVVASRQGRIVEFDPTGNVTFEYINRYNAEQGLYGLLSEVRVLTASQVERFTTCSGD